MQQEKIENLIPKEYIPPPKQKRYKSYYPSGLPPTGSTFCNKTTSRPNVYNLAGDFDPPKGPHDPKGLKKTFGQLKQDCKPKAQNFRKKGTGTMGSNLLPQLKVTYYYQPFKYPEVIQRRQNVPCVNDKPTMGLISNKDFIVSNAVQNILAAPKVLKQEFDWTKKKDYGMVPQYLQKIKQKINNQYQMIKNVHLHDMNMRDRQKYLLTKEEVDELRKGLKKKWQAVNKQYQSITYIQKIDTIGLKKKKQGCQKQLAQLERDMKKLNKLYIFIDTLQ